MTVADPSLISLMFVLLLVIGALAGVLAGMLGVGGGIVLVPALFYAFSQLGYGGAQLMQICLATSLSTIIVTSLRSLLGHHKKGAVEWKILSSWAPGIALGAIAGMLIASSLRSATLQMVFGVLAITVGVYMALGNSKWRLGATMPTGPVRALMSLVLGFLSVLMGIGGGSFGVPVMNLFGVPIHRAVATAAGFGVIIAVPAVIGFLFVQIDPGTRPPFTIGSVNPIAFVTIITMTLLTAPLGVKLAHKMDARPLKRVFGVFLTLVAVNMLRKAMGF